MTPDMGAAPFGRDFRGLRLSQDAWSSIRASRLLNRSARWGWSCWAAWSRLAQQGGPEFDAGLEEGAGFADGLEGAVQFGWAGAVAVAEEAVVFAA